MTKLLLALIILSAGAGGFLTARRSTIQLEREAHLTREACWAQTQQVVTAQRVQAGLVGRIRDLKQILTQMPTVADSPLWSTLQTNRADKLSPELRERVLLELDLNWQSSPDFILVTKQTLRDTGTWMLKSGKLSEVEAGVFAMTPEERSQVEAAIQRAQTDFNDWALAHAERSEPKDDELAHYVLPGDRAMVQSITNNLGAGILAALGQERAELLQRSVRSWIQDWLGLWDKPARIIVRRGPDGSDARLKVEIRDRSSPAFSGYLQPETRFPAAFRPVFPNGWEDLAKREGFELPEGTQKQ